jgi:2-dehydropantoate 2-reductase
MREMIRTADAMKIKVEPGSGGKLDYYRLIEDKGFLSKVKRHLLLRIAGFKYRRIKSSSLQSLERGRQSEIDYLNGYVCQQGQRLGISTPLNDAIVAMVKEIEVGSRPISWKNLESSSFAEYG